MKSFQNFIAGQWADAKGGATFDDVNPADTRDIVGRFPKSSPADVDRAVASAQRGFQIWSRTPAPARVQAPGARNASIDLA